MNRIVSILMFIAISFASYNDRMSPPGKDYYSDQNGDIYIYVNIIGHVKSPGSYLVHEDSDILTILAQAGGHLKGAKTSEVIIVSDNQESYTVNLDKIIMGLGDRVTIKPNDTIYVDETFGSFIFSSRNIVNVLIQITNLILIVSGNR